ncbi:MAG: protein kinase family protein with domain [Acidimicrobiaceae bacterium]|nr:protein kinase family protein with domain [Acidimicrobiaceae bacterium]
MTTITEQLGRVLAGRYRLDAGLGTGTSAHVYAAFDTRLGRQVAVKLLHPGLASDERFLRRLRAEAQAVAALNHPNVLKVFDWGDEHDGPFLVLEFLGGGSLQGLLDSGSRLDPAQAAAVGAQAARGLAYAHRRGFVHRDVKPGNLLFDEDGGLRVADFGLARALAEAAWTEPSGAVLGTARYSSPEQAQGRPLDDRSDVYSLALVLYEAVVGRVPFSADTTIATLMARVGAQLPMVPELGPLAPILAQAAISEPLARLNAEELADNLDLLARQLPSPRPIPMARSVTTSHRPADALRPAQHLGAAPASGGGAPEVPDGTVPARPVFYDGDNDGGAARGSPTELHAGIGTGIDSYPERERAEALVDPRRSRSRRRSWRRWLLALLVLAVLVAGGAVAAVRFVVYGHSVPELHGLQLSKARSDVARAGLQLEVLSSEYSPTVASGAVVSESLRAGKRERSGTVVGVVVSRGRAPVPVPIVAGKTQASATALLAARHLEARVSELYSESVAAGTVISSSPSSGIAAFGSPVGLVVSKGPAPRTIPSGLDGSGWSSVRSSIVALRLVPTEQLSYSTSIPAGDVIATSPAAGTPGIAVGTSIRVVVSKGPRLVSVPSVKGLPIASALATLQQAQLNVTEQIGPPNATYATTTDPLPGAEVAPGTQITLYVA